MASSVKELVETNSFTSVPSIYAISKKVEDSNISEEESVPIIDFSLLTSANPDQRCKVIEHLEIACRDWGFFVLINHGVHENLRGELVRASHGFFELTEEEKKEFAGNNFIDPIRYGTSFNARMEKTLCWRDYLKLHVHPHFNAPNKPPGFSEILEEYCKKTKEMTGELFKGISKSLGLEENFIHKRMSLESGSEMLVINYYPPCPHPETTIGLPPHTDHGLLGLVMQNGPDALQVQHNDKWVQIHPPPNSFLVHIGDHLEILTNGKYKGVIHQAVVKEEVRMSIGIAYGPPLETTVIPAPEFVSDAHPPLFRGITYEEFVVLKSSYQLDKKSTLERLRI